MAFPPSPTILMIRKLPPDLNNEEGYDLLQYFGARSVSIMSSKGHMKGTAFAEFGTRDEADIALKKLHQAPLFGSRLVVQYSDKNFMPVDSTDYLVLPPPPPPKAAEQPRTVDSVDPKTCNTPDPSLHYLYPPPTSHTLSNISHALVAVPQFYIQVLHLMNKMNLPPPFSKTSEKSIFESSENLDPPPLPSSSESELESDQEPELGETDKREIEKEILEEKRIATQTFIENRIPESDRKRKLEVSEASSGSAKVSRVINEKSQHSTDVVETVDMDMSDQEDIEVVKTQNNPTIDIDISSIQLPPEPKYFTETSLGAVLSSSIPKEHVSSIAREVSPSTPLHKPLTTAAQPKSSVAVSEVDEDPTLSTSKTVSPESSPNKPCQMVQADNKSQSNDIRFNEYRSSVRSMCLPTEQLIEHNVFKKYVKGDPSVKLYIKNLNHKQVQETDLTGLFLPYFEFYYKDGSNVTELEIKLMTRGQMKGQAFVTFSNVEAAESALSDLHGYVLHDKPMAIMFAKSK